MVKTKESSISTSTKPLPSASLAILGVIILCCLLAPIIAPYPSDYMDSSAVNLVPQLSHPFGTDHMGRDLLTMVLYGGQASIFIGLAAAAISTAIGIFYGTVSGLAGRSLDTLMMGITELIMSIPTILLVLFLQAILGQPTYLSLSVVIGVTGWTHIAKVVRSEVRQIRESDYVLAARTMGANFGYILKRHLLPNFVSSIMFMVVSNIGQAMTTEATLSFLGLGLPLTTVSWGSLLSMSQGAMLTKSWWIIVIPGAILVLTLTAVTAVGEYIRKSNNRLHSNL